MVKYTNMRIEKTSDNSIRCFIDRDELSYMHLNIDNIAYGNENAKTLFKKAIRAANEELGFDFENPLAVEAIPMQDGSIMLNITKIEMPDELDTRFSKFSVQPVNKESIVPSFMQIIGNIFDAEFDEPPQITASIIEIPRSNIRRVKKNVDVYNRVYRFDNLDHIIDACKNIQNRFRSSVNSVLYKDEEQSKYYLHVTPLNTFCITDIKADYNIVCNTLSEYGINIPSNRYNIAYYNEHYKTIISNEAISKLSSL